MVYSAIFLPLFSSIICGLFGNKMGKYNSAKLASLIMILSAILSSALFLKISIDGEVTQETIFKFISIEGFYASWSIYLDELSSIMIFVVTVVSAIVHIYSIGYMHDDPNLSRFMSYLSLFTFGMLMLVTSDNFVQLFFGWEAVGVCSYLLIGFWYKKSSANNAAIKAFIVNRVGDFGFIIGIIMIFYFKNSIIFSEVFAKAGDDLEYNINFLGFAFNAMEITCFMLFIGAMGKSAQIGLHVWLPDAMEGPTPVSALIHAATMVTAGVFLLARCSYLFEFAPKVRVFITIIGAITCVFAALIAIFQSDIKKIIAYSTCSQLGYMFISSGLSEYHIGIFHLFTHAFFKAMLFLAAGSVIHSTNEQDIEKMGGLRKKMPITFLFFVVGSVAIMGLPPFAGFYSKDLVLIGALESNSAHGNIAYMLGLFAAFCTSIYSTKILVKVFFGDLKNKSAHESPSIMNAPMVILLIGSVIAGYIGTAIMEINYYSVGYFKDSIFIKEFLVSNHHPFYIELIPAFIALMGIAFGYIIYSGNFDGEILKGSRILKVIRNKFYFDEIYNLIFVRSNYCLSKALEFFDKRFIDFIGPILSRILSVKLSHRITALHCGLVNYYALSILIGMISLLGVIILKFVV